MSLVTQGRGPWVTKFDPSQGIVHFHHCFLLINHINVTIHWFDTAVFRVHFLELIIAWKQSILRLDCL